MCFEERKRAVSLVAGCSGLAVIAALVMIIFSVLFRNKEIWEAGVGPKEATDVRDMAFGFLLVCSILALLLGLLGVSTLWIKNRCCNICLSILLFPTWVIIVIFGVVLTMASGVSTDLAKELCDGVKVAETQLAEEAANGGDNADDTNMGGDSSNNEAVQEALDFLSTDVIDTYMCSEYCPCVAVANNPWLKIKLEDAQQKNRGGFTVQVPVKNEDGSDKTETVTDENGVESEEPVTEEYTTPYPWYFGDKFYDVGDLTSTGTDVTQLNVKDLGTFETFQSCIEHAHTRTETDWNKEFLLSASMFKEQKNGVDIFTLVGWLEENYMCSGFCVTDMFFQTRNISEGIPTQGCLEPLAEDFGSVFRGIGVAGIICGIVLFLAFIFSYCLWKQYDD